MNSIETFQNVLEYIELNLEENIATNELSKIACISLHHMYRIFTAMVGVPIHEYIRKRRLANSAKDLLKSNERIIEIAFKYGFESQEAFSRAFKKEFSFTPAKFRKEKPKIWY